MSIFFRLKILFKPSFERGKKSVPFAHDWCEIPRVIILTSLIKLEFPVLDNAVESSFMHNTNKLVDNGSLYLSPP